MSAPRLFSHSRPTRALAGTRAILPGLGLCVAVTAAAVGFEAVEAHLFGRAWLEALVQRIPLANVASPDRMTVVSGNVFLPSAESGEVNLGYPQSKGLGKIMSGTLEESNADIAQELTDMIEAQRSYTANSKVFQTGSELMDVLVNLKR